jgi:hypothetical protein
MGISCLWQFHIDLMPGIQINAWEKSVTLNLSINLSQIQAIGIFNSHAINLLTANHHNLFGSGGLAGCFS